MSERSFAVRAAPVAVLAAGVLLFALFSSLSGEPESAPISPPPVTVETLRAQPEERARVIDAQGIVTPARAVEIRPQVSGRVVDVNPRLQAGAQLAAGEKLLVIDDRDYRLAVDAAKSQVERASAELALEQGRRKVAETEWALFENDLTDVEADRTLATREPQLAAARAALTSARAQLATAELNLERTELVAPFDATVLQENVSPGQTVAPTSVLVSLAAVDAFHVQVSLPLADLVVIGEGANASRAVVSLRAGEYETRREATVIEKLDSLAEGTRLARVLVQVDAPLSPEGGPPLLLGSYVDVAIEAVRASTVIALPDSALRAGDRVFVVTGDGVLAARDVAVSWRDANTVYVSDGLEEGEEVVVSALAVAAEGLRVTRASAQTASTTEP